MGINCLVEAFERRGKYRGSYDDDIERKSRRVMTLSRVCGVSDDEKLNEIPIMLNGAGVDLFYEYKERRSNYEHAFELIRNWYFSYEQRARVISKFKNVRFTEEMAKKPYESEMTEFRAFVAHLFT